MNVPPKKPFWEVDCSKMLGLTSVMDFPYAFMPWGVQVETVQIGSTSKCAYCQTLSAVQVDRKCPNCGAGQ